MPLHLTCSSSSPHRCLEALFMAGRPSLPVVLSLFSALYSPTSPTASTTLHGGANAPQASPPLQRQPAQLDGTAVAAMAMSVGAAAAAAVTKATIQGHVCARLGLRLDQEQLMLICAAAVKINGTENRSVLLKLLVLQVGATGKALTNIVLVGISGTVIALLDLYLCILHSRLVNYRVLES